LPSAIAQERGTHKQSAITPASIQSLQYRGNKNDASKWG